MNIVTDYIRSRVEH